MQFVDIKFYLDIVVGINIVKFVLFVEVIEYSLLLIQSQTLRRMLLYKSGFILQFLYYFYNYCSLSFRKFNVALNLIRIFLNFAKVSPYPAYQNSVIRKNFTVPFLKYKRLKLKLMVFLAGHNVAMVTYCVTKIIPTCSPVNGQFSNTMIVASIGKEW